MERSEDVVFRFATSAISVELDGSEAFVKPHIDFLLPFVRGSTGAGGAEARPAPQGIEGVAAWWEQRVPPSASPSLQDSILLFAYYMRSYRKTVFVSEDIRRSFGVMGIEEPKSLLQILGTLKRDHGYLLNAGKRGEYMMNTTGIARAREILGEPSGSGRGTGREGDAAPLRPKAPDVRSIFKD